MKFIRSVRPDGSVVKIIPSTGPDGIMQRSEEWYRLHIGRPTASMFKEFITPAKLEYARSKGAKTAMYRLAAERLLGRSFSKPLDGLRWIEEGKEQEPKAVQQYEFIHKVKTFLISFMMTDDERAGASPDAIVEGDEAHGVEIKSLFPPKMVRLAMEGPDNEHVVQVLGQMAVGRLETNDYFAYNEDMPPFVKTWTREQSGKLVDLVRGHVTNFCDDLDECVEAMKRTGFFQAPAVAKTALDLLVDRLRWGDKDDRVSFPGCENLNTLAALQAWKADPANAAALANLPADKAELVLESWQYRYAFLSGSA